MKRFYFLLIIISISACTKNSNEIKYSEVVNRMVDMNHLATLPAKGETSGMFSSYDRKSAYDTISGSYQNWSANNDGLSPQYIRKEGDNMVLAEMDGPGAIVRIWSANPLQGHVKIFIDDADTAIIDLPFIDYFNAKKLPAFSFPQLVYETDARGFNNYVPITFQKSIKIIGEPKWGQYYHFNYITFPEGTHVEKFDTLPSDIAQKALEQVNHYFEEGLGNSERFTAKSSRDIKQIKLAPGEEKVVYQLSGKRAITGIRVRLAEAFQTPEIMRKTALSIFWDNEEKPSVWVPLGDFFGSAPGFNNYRTLPMGMLENQVMYSNWYMPFETLAEIHLKNNNAVPVELELNVFLEKNRMKEFARFHAKWHRDWSPVDSTRWPDWTILKTEGSGRFVGMSLSVWNPKGGHCVQFGGEGQHWWGEGDEKFFVDGEKFPSTFGTGTEDYFGYAWCVPNFFEHAFHSQNYTDKNMGHQSLTRWQIIDNVPFQNLFEAYLEKYFPNQWPTQYATVAYWYLSKDGDDSIGPSPADEMFAYETPFEIFKAENAIEGENMKIIQNTGGWAGKDIFVKEYLYPQVSGHKVLVWYGKKDGENILTTGFSMPDAGKYAVSINKVCTKDGGQFTLYLNDYLLKKNVDFCSGEDQQSQLELLGIVDLDKGNQELKINWEDKPDSGKKLMLDYLKLEPVK